MMLVSTAQHGTTCAAQRECAAQEDSLQVSAWSYAIVDLCAANQHAEVW
jgi:hypothetical protein